MKRLKAMDDIQLQKELRRLERDVEDFRARAAHAAAAAVSGGRSVVSDPLHQRLASIHDFLGERLKDAQALARTRAAGADARPRWSLGSLFQANGAASAVPAIAPIEYFMST